MRPVNVRRRALGGAVAILLLAAACSGNKSQLTGGGPSAAPDAASGPLSSSGPQSSASGGSRSSGGVSTIGGGGGFGGPVTGPNVAGTQQKTSAGFTYKAANLYPASQDRIGVSSSTITLCMHAALALGPAFHDSAQDFQVYWQYLNDHGGVYGRKVNMVFTDDAYTPTGGTQAAQQCFSNNPEPLFMMAGIGFDTVPAVRQWAEQNHKLYLHSFATEKGLYTSKYSFEMSPSVEHFGDVAGKFVAKKYPGGTVGVVWRNSPNWQGGRDNYKKRVAAAHSKVVDLPVSQNQGNYTNEILALKTANATTVLAWVNVLEFVQLEKQAAQQGFYPRWVVAGFNLVTDTAGVGDDINGSQKATCTSPKPCGNPAVGVWVTPEYHNGTLPAGWAGEAKVMRDAYAKYDSGHDITDTDWQAWLAFKSTTKMLMDCGKDCTRNKVAGMMLSGYPQNLPPLCGLDFKRGRGKLGAFAFNFWHAVKRGSGSGWQQDLSCKEDF